MAANEEDLSKAKLEEKSWMPVVPVVIVVATFFVWTVLVAFSITHVLKSASPDRFIDAGTKLLLPLFNSTIVASLAYVFGKPVARAVAKRIAR